MAQNVYEGMYILDSNRYGRDADGVSGRIAEMVQKAGGEILVSRLWEERRLAYPVKGHRKGTYWLTYFRLDSSQLGNIKRQCQLNDDILRTLFLKVDPRIVDTLVAHAQADRPTRSVAEEIVAGDTDNSDGDEAVGVAEGSNENDD